MPQPKPAVKVPLVVIPTAQLQDLANDNDKKQFLGNYLYQFVLRSIEMKKESYPEEADQANMAGKVTGMILDGQTIDFILYLCGDKTAFYQIVGEAVSLIETSDKKQVVAWKI